MLIIQHDFFHLLVKGELLLLCVDLASTSYHLFIGHDTGFCIFQWSHLNKLNSMSTMSTNSYSYRASIVQM